MVDQSGQLSGEFVGLTTQRPKYPNSLEHVPYNWLKTLKST